MQQGVPTAKLHGYKYEALVLQFTTTSMLIGHQIYYYTTKRSVYDNQRYVFMLRIHFGHFHRSQKVSTRFMWDH